MPEEKTVIEMMTRLETQLTLLKEWKENIEAAIELSDGACFDESDKIDDRCIEIEEFFESEYGITFDSFGDMYS